MSLRRSLPVILGLSLLAAPARAVEGQLHLGAGAGLATLNVADKSTASVGVGYGVDVRYGLTDAFNLHAEVLDSIVATDENLDHPDTPRTRPSGVTTFGVGAGYAMDIATLVPHISLLLGGAGVSGGTLERPAFMPAAQVGLGLDYYLSRSWALGVVLRQHVLLGKLATYPSFTTTLLRVEYSFW